MDVASAYPATLTASAHALVRNPYLAVGNRWRAVAITLAASVAASCASQPCTQRRMIERINQSLQEANENPREWFVAETIDEGELMYFGMAPKERPTHRFHYLIDERTCELREVWADQ